MDTRAGAGYAASWTTEGTSGEKTVTEQEWLACTDPKLMLGYLRFKCGVRKLRLFTAACLRRDWHWSDMPIRIAIKSVERLAGLPAFVGIGRLTSDLQRTVDAVDGLSDHSNLLSSAGRLAPTCGRAFAWRVRS